MKLLLKLSAVLLAGLLCGGPVDAGMVLSAPAAGGGGVPVNTQGPTVSGSIAVAATNAVSCTTGSWTNSPTSYTYQWFRDGSTSIGTNSANYTTVSADLGHLITCKVTAANGSGPAASASPASNPAGNCAQSSSYLGRIWLLPATFAGTLGTVTGGITSGGTLNLGYSDALICNLVADAVWPLLDALWTTATADATNSLSISQQIANLNLVSSSYTLVLHPGSGTPVFQLNQGYTGGAESNITVWIDTGYNPATAASGGGQWASSGASAHLMGWTLVSYHSTGYAELIGGAGPSNSAAVLPWTAASPASIIADVNYGSTFSYVNNPTDSRGSTIASRTGASTVAIYRNGVAQTLAAGSSTATGNPNANIYMLAGNNNGGTIVNGGPYQISAASVGAGLTAAQVNGGSGAGLHNRICTYLTGVHGSC